MKVLAIAEQRDGALRKVSLEVVSAAREVAAALGGTVEAVLVGGPGAAALAPELAAHGAAVIHVAEHDALGTYSPDGYAATIAALLGAGDYFGAFFPASAQGKDLAPRVAAKLDVPLATEATALKVEDGELVVTRPMYAGRVFADVTLAGGTRIVSLRPNVFRASESAAAGDVKQLSPAGSPADWRVKVREVKAATGGRLDVGEAPIVVSGGRGMKGPENWNLLEDLRAAFGDTAALGASRAVVDAGWRPHSEQVGQTGKTVSPQLYIAVAISGAMQHLAGMRSAGTIVAINKDPEAPIFKVADYGVVGDATEILPRLSDEVRKARGA